jgi:hypothetical protein
MHQYALGDLTPGDPFPAVHEEEMRILDESTDRPVTEITIFLSVDEATALYQQIRRLVLDPRLSHVHVQDDDKQRQLILALYGPSKTVDLGQRVHRLIMTGE